MSIVFLIELLDDDKRKKPNVIRDEYASKQ